MPPLFLIAAASAVPMEPPSRVASEQPARAVVRIVRAIPIRFGEDVQIEAGLQREATIRERDGSVRSASLIVFY